MKILSVIIAFILLTMWGCRVTDVSITSYNPPPENSGQSNNLIILVNGFDIKDKQYRDNKEALFKKLLTNMMTEMREDILFRSSAASIIIADTFRLPDLPAEKDSVVGALLEWNNATHAIVINSINVFFTQTDVEVRRTENGKEREAFYDISAEVGYIWYPTWRRRTNGINPQQSISFVAARRKRIFGSRS